MHTIAPSDYARVKRELGKRKDRDSLKARNDLLQANLVENSHLSICRTSKVEGPLVFDVKSGAYGGSIMFGWQDYLMGPVT